ncbi:MAG: RNA polymerase sigma factor [Myxococcota bacterium]
MDRDGLYREAAEQFGAALGRLAGGYEADPERRRDLVQDIHAALWRSLETFDRRCSLRTWAFRVAHNVATSHLIRHAGVRFVELDEVHADADVEAAVDRQLALERLRALIHQLPPLERQVILLWLEGLDAVAISDVTGLSPSNVATRVHRIKAALTRTFHERTRR